MALIRSLCRLQFVLLFWTIALLANLASAAAAAELVLFEVPGCPFCEAWQRDVGRIYVLSAEARLLPLRRVNIDARPADLAGIADIRFTPTFVVIAGGREVGRIVGYHGEYQFWGLLGELVEKVKAAAD
jgi:thioredoxin-related protein